MTETRVQVPDELMAQLQQLARERDWSIEEALRRGAELLLQSYASPEGVGAWRVPTSNRVGWKGLDDAQLRTLVLNDQSPTPDGR